MMAYALPTRFLVGSKGKIDPKLKMVIRLLCLDSKGEERGEIDRRIQSSGGGVSNCEKAGIDFVSWENEMDMLDSLRSMMEMKLDNLIKGREGGMTREAEAEGEMTVRDEVRKMIEIYKDGMLSAFHLLSSKKD